MSASLISEIVRLHRAQLFGVIEIRGVGRLKKIYADARTDLEERLRGLQRSGKGQTFTAHHLRLVLAQVADTIRGFEGPFIDHLQDAGRIAGNLAPRHLTSMIGTLDPGELRADNARHPGGAGGGRPRGAYESAAPTLLETYKRSARLYGPQAIVAIRNGMAGSIVRGEGVDETIDRVVGSTGLFQGQRWRRKAERLVRTETAYSYGVTNQRSMEQLKPAVPKMQKRLVATFDDRTGKDSKELNGETVPVDQPFRWVVKNARGEPTGKAYRVATVSAPNRPP